MSTIDKPGHARREFLRAVAGVTAVAGLAAAGASAGTASAALAATDVYEVNLLSLGVSPQRYTTVWPTGTNRTVNVWDAALRKAISLLAAQGGGRLWIPGNDEPYYLRDHHIFDLPSVSVHLAAGSEVMMVGPKNPAVGTPIGFYGGMGDLVPPRFPRDFAALNGPGRIGYPAAQLEYYERGNAVGFSYIRTVHVEGVEVPCAPRYAMTAQYGCNKVTFRNNVVGHTGTPGEVRLGGHAVIGVSGGLYDDTTRTVDPYGRRTTVLVAGNTVTRGHRGLYLEHCGQVTVTGNRLGPLDGTGMTLGNCLGATVTANTLRQVSRTNPGHLDAMQFVDVTAPVTVTGNTVGERTHRHCVLSSDSPNTTTRPGRIVSRNNHWTMGRGAVFAGAPTWDSAGDTIS